MACRYYDDIIVEKLKKWIPENSKLRVLKPDESKRLFELTADDNNDQAFKMPFIALSRNNDISLLSTVKQPKSFDGLRLFEIDNTTGKPVANPRGTAVLNVIPIGLNYQLDIYTKKFDEAEEYVRSFLFKLINNPLLIIDIPYNSINVQETNGYNGILRHTANIRVTSTVSDTSSISERIFSGQFTRWTIQFELQDAFLFNIPYKKNWIFVVDDSETNLQAELRIANSMKDAESTDEFEKISQEPTK